MKLRVFLSHTPEMFEGFYGPRALAALSEHAEVIRNPGATVLSGGALAEAARGCHAIVADRTTPGLAETFSTMPELLAFLRVAVDISTIDVPAASAAGVLVTRATPGFVDAVVELGLGFMVDLARDVSAMVGTYRAGGLPQGRMGLQLSEARLGIIGYGRIGQRLQVHDSDRTAPRKKSRSRRMGASRASVTANRPHGLDGDLPPRIDCSQAKALSQHRPARQIARSLSAC